MFNWYNKNAPQNTIVRYLSTKYTVEQLHQLKSLSLPDQFESFDYSNELALILKDSPWNIHEVKYKTSSLTSLKGIFSQDYWFGKKITELEKIKDLVPKETKKEAVASANNSATAAQTSDETIQPFSFQSPTYFYYFCTDQENKVTHWKTPHTNWQTAFFSDYWLETTKSYANQQVLLETSAKLPAVFNSQVNTLFELVTRKEMLTKQDWVYAYLVESKELDKCAKCLTNLLPESEQVCRKCSTHPLPLTPNWWEVHQDLLIITSLLILALIIAQTN